VQSGEAKSVVEGSKFAFSKASSREQKVGKFIITADDDILRIFAIFKSDDGVDDEDTVQEEEEYEEEEYEEEEYEKEDDEEEEEQEEVEMTEEEEEEDKDKTDKDTAPVAFFRAPAPIQTVDTSGAHIAVGCQNGEVLQLRAAVLLTGV
jgi:hypothetical protein